MSEKKIEFKCCYCKNIFPGEAPFGIPEGFPTNKVHELKPLCEGCGGSPSPTLDAICEALDKELAAESALKVTTQLINTALLDLSEDERMVVLKGLSVCLRCGQNLAGPFTGRHTLHE